VAERISPLVGAIVLGDLERAVDDLFEDLLLSRWRAPLLERAPVVDHGAHYEVRIQAAGADPRLIEIEVNERRLTVRIPDIARPIDHSFELPQTVDAAAVTARWIRYVLEIKLPKKPGRKITVE